jgi:hypothetical protein
LGRERLAGCKVLESAIFVELDGAREAGTWISFAPCSRAASSAALAADDKEEEETL